MLQLLPPDLEFIKSNSDVVHLAAERCMQIASLFESRDINLDIEEIKREQDKYRGVPLGTICMYLIPDTPYDWIHDTIRYCALVFEFNHRYVRIERVLAL